MAAMPFPCNGILDVQGNLTRVFPVCTWNYASFLIPFYNFYVNNTKFYRQPQLNVAI